MKLVIYNGHTGGLGRHLGSALATQGFRATILKSRLEDSAGIFTELRKISITAGDEVTFIPLAAMVPIVVCEKAPHEAFKTNVLDTMALISQLRTWTASQNATYRVVYVSTGHVYAPKPTGEKLAEKDPVLPRSVYAQTKLQAENAAFGLFKADPKNLMIARVFGLLAPDQSVPYVLPSLIKRVRERNFTGVAGLDCVRDYLDARDVCRILAEICKRDWSNLTPPNVLNICSGEGTAIRDLFATALEAGGLSLTQIEPTMTTSPPRPDDIPWMVGDPSLMTNWLGTPLRRIPLRQTVQEATQSI